LHRRAVRGLAPPIVAEELTERELELQALREALAGLASARGAVILVEGAAGTGKSCLIAALAELSGGVPTYRARAVEFDRSLPLAVARRLLAPGLREVAACSRHDHRVEQALDAIMKPTPRSAAPLVERGGAALYAIAEGVEALVDVLGPLVIAVDDAHLADAPTVRLLVHLAERAQELPVVLAVAARRGQLDDSARLRCAPGAWALEPGNLSDAAVSAFVARRLPGATDDVVAACRRVTGGNPFLLRELLNAVASAGAVTGEQVEQLAPRRVIDGVRARLAELPAGAGELAQAIAVLGDGARLRHAQALAGLEPASAAAVADALVAADILEPGDPLAFRHPLIASAIEHHLGTFTRAELHRRAAELLVAEGDDQRAAAHLVFAAPTGDQRVVARLEAAAAAAAERGDAAAARRLLRRALDEPADRASRPELLVALARVEAALGDADALVHLDEAVGAIDDDARAASVLRQLARVHQARMEFTLASRIAARALERAGTAASDRLRATWMLAASLDPESVPAFLQALGRLVAHGSEDPELQAILALALLSQFGDPVDAARLASASVEGEIAGNDDGLGLSFAYSLSALLHAGELARLEQAATRAVDWARERGSITAMAIAGVWRGLGRLARGDLDGAQADAEIALRPLRSGWNADAPQAYALLARVELERGDLDAARAAIEAGAATGGSHPPFLYGRGLVQMRCGDARGAIESFTHAGELVESLWRVDNPAFLPWRTSAALAALQAGRRREAAEWAGEELRRARRTRTPWMIGIALRSEALVAEREDRLREALSVLRGSEHALEAVRTQVELGAALRRAGERRAARAELAAARDHAAQLGLTALAARAEEEHRASGGRPRRTRISGAESLTPSERRMAERARAGASNRQIAAELFLTVKTVEWHMSNAFRKLDISSRQDLARALPDSDGHALPVPNR
jgi:DNA-binding CsgD family transcriptional regulator